MASNNLSDAEDTTGTGVECPCFVCDKIEIGSKLTRPKKNGKKTLRTYCVDNGNEILLEKLDAAWNCGNLACHESCKLNLFNTARTGKQRKKERDESEREEVRKKKKRDNHDRTESVFLPYKNKCILCNQLVALYLKNPEMARKTYSKPDSFTAPQLRKRIHETASERLTKSPEDKWALEVKARLSGISDLVAAEVLLHKKCNTNFTQGCGGNGEGETGRKVDEGRKSLFDKLCVVLDEEMEHNLMTLEELQRKMVDLDDSEDKSQAYTKRHLKTKLLERYGDKIYFSSQERRTDVLCFKDTTSSIIREYHDHNDGSDEKTRIINTAVKLIQNDIARVDLDSFCYPSISSMTDIHEQLGILPESLKLFLKPLVKTDKRIAAWGQSFIKTIRPRSGVLPRTMQLALQLDHKYGSKWLLDEMHSLGYCESYHEVSNYKYCVLRSRMQTEMQPSGSLFTIDEEPDDADEVDNQLQKTPDSEANQSNSETVALDKQQFIGDNIDLNIVSINGNTPFHAMGWIKVGTRKLNNETLSLKVPRCRLKPTEKARILKAGDIPIKPCPDPKKSGIDSMEFQPLEKLVEKFSDTPANPHPLDAIWSAGWIIKKNNNEFSHSNWNGWMKSVHKSEGKEVNDIEYMPIIDGDPNNHSTIHTLLQKALQMDAHPIVTFDLPIWIKSVDIIKSKKLSVIPRLGGFHLLKSFLGTFDSIFADSGLHELVQLIYPGSTVADSILNGGSYDKAIRSHFLIDAAIIQHVIPSDMFSDEELSQIKETITNLVENKTESQYQDIPVVKSFQEKIDEVFSKFSAGGRTTALWALYHDMVSTIKIFIRAERTGDFQLHLSCITNRMLHIFAAAGHHYYAKGARLYVQMMLSYEKGSPQESAIVRNFKMHGNHVIRYSSFEWSGIWSDLCIEQTLMRFSKSDGGLTGGRFRNGDSAHKCWVQTLSHISMINRLSQKNDSKKFIHRDLAAAQRLADEGAIATIGNWLNDMQPFDETRDRDLLVSFSTGFFSKRGDEINSEKAVEVGKVMQTKLDNQVPSTPIETKNKVKSLSFLRGGSNVHSPTRINALKYFNRLVIFAQRESNLEKSLAYELTPLPLSLFSEKDQLMLEA